MTEIRVEVSSRRWPLRWPLPYGPRFFFFLLMTATACAAIGAKSSGLLRLNGEAILSAAGRAWIVTDELAPADAAAVLGGGHETRPAAAASLFKAGLVKHVLVSTGETGGEKESTADRDELIKLGVPPSAITQFSIDPRNTYGEARALAFWASQHGAERIIVPTEIFPSRRVQWIMRRELGSVGATAMVEAVTPGGFGLNDWWHSAQARQEFGREVLKYVFYRLVYATS
jgi:uncharacterized SAM-binding protein YcdF (DUF218 family)